MNNYLKREPHKHYMIKIFKSKKKDFKYRAVAYVNGSISKKIALESDHYYEDGNDIDQLIDRVKNRIDKDWK